MKALILTFAPVNEDDKELIRNTKIDKFAINGHAEDLNPDCRIISDYGIILFMLEHFKQKIISVRETIPNERVINASYIQFKGSTLICLIDYLIFNKYDEILIVGDNSVRAEFFKKRINDEMEIIKKQHPEIKIYQYVQGNYNLPVKSVKGFINDNN